MSIDPKRIVLLLLLPGILLLHPWSASAIEFTPFATRNQSPLIQIYGLPPAEPAILVDSGRFSTTLSLDVANNFAESADIGESVLLDGETYRTNLGLRYGLNERVEIGFDLPYVSHDRGFLDGFIEGWHDTFGLPEGARSLSPRDRLIYRYQRNGSTQVNLTDSVSGLGDLRLNVGWQLYREAGTRPSSATFRLSLKLPTGDSDKLLGSGGTDFAMSLAEQREFPVKYGRFFAYTTLGVLLMSDGEVLDEQRRNFAGFGSMSFGWAPYDWLALKLQADGHTSMYNGSNMEEIDSGSVQLVIGGSLQLAEQTTLDLAVSEDVMVNTAPDVVFHLALRTLF